MSLKRRSFLLGCAACGAALWAGAGRAAESVPALKDHFKDRFRIGLEIDPPLLSDPVTRRLVLKHANSLSPGNVMRPDLIGVSEGVYNFKPAEDLVAFARANGMGVRGVILLWHAASPDWFFAGDQTNLPAYRALVRARLERYVTDVVTHFKGRIYCWDVVNEVTSDIDGNDYRLSRWYEVLGPDHIDHAFRAARAADPDAQLLINEYHTENPSKRARLLAIIDGMRARGVPIDGVGHQLHISIVRPASSVPADGDSRQAQVTLSALTGEVDAAVTAVEARGLINQVTEMDVSLYNDPQSCYDHKTRCQPTITKADLPAALQIQADTYRKMFAVFTAHSSVEAVTFWGVADSLSWLDELPIKRPNHPLLFDARGLPKPAFWAVVGRA